MPYICKNPWTTLYIWGNGNVTHCCYSNIGSLGNINETPLLDIWRGPKLNSVRENMAQGNYLQAGCEYFCRSYRWNKFYGSETAAAIPEGLGRMEELPSAWAEDGPGILGFGIDWDCNLRCRHCLSSRKGKGVKAEDFQALRTFTEKSRFLRFMGGEFTINKDCLSMLKELGTWEAQPAVFFSTNGQTSLASIMPYCGELKGLHLKFSLEGLNADYEHIRRGASWDVFERNLDEAAAIFAAKRAEGKDWRLYLNFCVMRSNFRELPSIIRYAVKKDLPLVLNTINGMRHIDENMFMYSAACPPKEEIQQIAEQCRAILGEAGQYCFKSEFATHLDYILRSANDNKLGLPRRTLQLWRLFVKGRAADLSMYAFYRLSMNPTAFLSYAYRKIRGKIESPKIRFKTARRIIEHTRDILRGWAWNYSVTKAGKPETSEFRHRIGEFQVPIKERGELGVENKNRISNMRIACEAIDMLVLRPGEIFSMRKIIGEPVAQKGYKPGPVIIRGKLSSSVGGGLCQISTVLFNAALQGNMRILEKHNHSVDLWGEERLVELGRDAAYTYELKDLKFRNDMAAPVLIRISADGEKRLVRAELYCSSPLSGAVTVETLADTKPGEVTHIETRRFLKNNGKMELTYSRRETYRSRS